MDFGGKFDPYLRFHLNNKKDSTAKTKVISNTLDPIWNEKFEIISINWCDNLLVVDMFDEEMDSIKIPLRDLQN